MLDQSSRKDIETINKPIVITAGGMFKRKDQDNNSPTDSQATNTQVKGRDKNKVYPETDTEIDNKNWRKVVETSGNFSESDTTKPISKPTKLANNNTQKSLLNPIAEADYFEELRGQTIITNKSIDSQSGVAVKSKLIKPAQQVG